jgi:hypothetical protein
MQPHRVYFVSDQHLILLTSQRNRNHGCKGEHDFSAAWVIATRSGEVKQLLTPGDNIYLGQTGLGRIIGLSPDKKTCTCPHWSPIPPRTPIPICR